VSVPFRLLVCLSCVLWTKLSSVLNQHKPGINLVEARTYRISSKALVTLGRNSRFSNASVILQEILARRVFVLVFRGTVAKYTVAKKHQIHIMPSKLRNDLLLYEVLHSQLLSGLNDLKLSHYQTVRDFSGDKIINNNRMLLHNSMFSF